MKSLNYLRRLALEARWRLPQGEAEEVIADYTELLEGDARSQRELFRDLGTPREAVRLLDEKDNAYRRWTATLVLFLLYIGVPWAWLFTQEHHTNYSILLLLLGAASSVRWFRRTGQRNLPKKTSLPRGLRPLLAVQAMGILAVLVFIVMVKKIPPEDVYDASWIGETGNRMVLLAGTFAFLSGLFGVMRARMADRRWCGAYIFGLTAVVFCVQILACLHSMNLDGDFTLVWIWIAKRCSFVLVMGLAASGVALC